MFCVSLGLSALLTSAVWGCQASLKAVLAKERVSNRSQQPDSPTCSGKVVFVGEQLTEGMLFPHPLPLRMDFPLTCSFLKCQQRSLTSGRPSESLQDSHRAAAATWQKKNIYREEVQQHLTNHSGGSETRAEQRADASGPGRTTGALLWVASGMGSAMQLGEYISEQR